MTVIAAVLESRFVHRKNNCAVSFSEISQVHNSNKNNKKSSLSIFFTLKNISIKTLEIEIMRVLKWPFLVLFRFIPRPNEELPKKTFAVRTHQCPS